MIKRGRIEILLHPEQFYRRDDWFSERERERRILCVLQQKNNKNSQIATICTAWQELENMLVEAVDRPVGAEIESPSDNVEQEDQLQETAPGRAQDTSSKKRTRSPQSDTGQDDNSTEQTKKHRRPYESSVYGVMHP